MTLFIFTVKSAAGNIGSGNQPAPTNSPPTTNQLSARTLRRAYSMKPEDTAGDSFLELFKRQMALDESGSDRIGYIGRINFWRAELRQTYSLHEYYNSVGRGIYISTFKNSAREASVARLPYSGTYSWLEEGRVGRFLNDFIEGSVGNTREELLQFGSALPNLPTAEEVFWRPDPTVSLHYGLRWSYAYLQTDIGHHWGGLPVIHIDTRLSATVPTDRFDKTLELRLVRLESNVIFPLPYHCQVVFSGKVYPGEYLRRSIDYTPSGSVRLERVIGNGRLFGIASAGCSSGPHETVIFGQIVLPLDMLGKLWHK